MAQQIKKKFIGNDQIDSTKIKLLQNQAVRAVDSTGTEQELIKLGATDEVLVKGQEVGLKSEIEAEESRAMVAESGLQSDIESEESRAMSAEGSLQTLIEEEESRAMAEESSIRALISGNSTDQSQLVEDEESRAMAAEASIVSLVSGLEDELDQEISARQADVNSEESRAVAAETSLQTQITDHESRLDVLEQDPTTKTYVDGEVSGLQTQIDNVLSNIDPAALDSLTEIVSAFQSADDSLEGTISTLAFNSSEAIEDEESRAMAAELSLQSSITAEQSRAQFAESNLQVAIEDEESRAMVAETSLQSSINAEQSRAQFEESNLQVAIEDEESRAMAVESSIQSSFNSHVDEVESRLSTLEANPTTESYVDGQISSVQSSISSEQSRAQSAESTLQASIDSEESRAELAESNLQVAIDDEESRAMAAESSLFAIMSGLGDELDQEISARQADVDAEESRAMVAETSLQSAIESEESRAEAAESSLQVQLTDHESRLDVLETDPVTKTYVDGEVSDLQGQIDNVLSNIDPASLDSLTEIVSAFQAADSTLQGTISTLANNSSGNIQSEESRAMAAEASIVTSLNQEISDRQDDVNSEESRAMAAELSLQSDIESEESRAMVAESSIVTSLNQEISARQLDVDSEESRAMAAESSLQSQFSSSISSEQSRAVAAESSLQSAITAEISNRVVDVDAEESRAIVAETSLATRITDLENVSFNKESFVVGSNGVGTSYVDLAHEVNEMSLIVFVDRLALHKEEDYTVSVVSGVTRITYTGSFASGGDEAVTNGDKIFVTYSFVDAGNGGGGSGGGSISNPMVWHNASAPQFITGSNGSLEATIDSSLSFSNEVGFSGPFEVTYTFNGFFPLGGSSIGFGNYGGDSWKYGFGQYMTFNGTNTPKLGNGENQGSPITGFGFNPLSSGLNTVTFKMTSGGQVSVVINGLELSIGSYAAGNTYWAGARLRNTGEKIESTSLVVG